MQTLSTNDRQNTYYGGYLTQYCLKLFHQVGNLGNPRKNMVMAERLLVTGEPTATETWYLTISLVEKLCAEKRI